MTPFFVVPLVVAIQDHLGMINRIKFVAIDDLPMKVGVKRLDVGVVLRSARMGELAVNALFLSTAKNV